MTDHKSSPIRVLHVVGAMNVGGAELRMLDMLRHTDRAHFCLDFCALSTARGELDNEIEELGSTIYRLPLELSFVLAFTRLLKDVKPDVVHAHVHYASGLIMRLAAREKVPVRITHFRSSSDARPSSRMRKLEKRVLKAWIRSYATDILAVSQASMEGIWADAATGDPRFQVIYNGRDLTAFRPSDEKRRAARADLGLSVDRTVFIHVGRFAAAKNHDALLDIFQRVHKIDTNTSLLLVGDGSPERVRQLRNRVTEAGLGNAVHFLGIRRDIDALLAAADIMVFPSLWEGLPGAVVEACASGLPVVASDIRGVLEVAQAFPGQVVTMNLALNSTEEWARCTVDTVRAWGYNRRQLIADSDPENSFAMDGFLDRLGAIWERSRKSIM